MKEPKILVGSPVYEGTRYSIREFIDVMKSLEYENYDILLVDNSKTDVFFQELKKESGIKVIKDDSKEDLNLKKVVSSRNKILQQALNQDYEYVLMMDSDVIPPKNLLKQLLQCQKDIISGLYYNYFRISGDLKFLPVAWKFLTQEQFDELKKQTSLPSKFKSPSDLRRHLTEEEISSKKILEVGIPSPGCMLLSKPVFTKIRYGLLGGKSLTGTATSDDIYFMKQAREANFRAYCNTKLKCKHLLLQKFKPDEDGNLKHPLHESNP